MARKYKLLLTRNIKKLKEKYFKKTLKLFKMIIKVNNQVIHY